MKLKLAKILILLASLILVLSALEGVARVFFKNDFPVIGEEDELIGATFKKNLDIDYPAENSKGVVRLKTNEYGFIGTDWNFEKDRSVLRIVNLGDSFTAGIAVPYQKNYVTLLGEKLSSALNEKIESLNFGIDGQGTEDSKKTYEAYARNFNPDIAILWMYTGNDLTDNLKNSGKAAESSVAGFKSLDSDSDDSFLEMLVANSALWQLAKRAAVKSDLAHYAFNFAISMPVIKNIVFKTVFYEYKLPSEILVTYTDAYPDTYKIALEETKKNLENFKNSMARDEKYFFVVMIPSQFEVDESAEDRLFKQYSGLSDFNFNKDKPREDLNRILTDLNIPHLDLKNDFSDICSGQDNCGLYICRYCHLSEEGHEVASDSVSKALLEHYFYDL